MAIYYGNYLAGLSFLLGFVSGAVHLHSRGIFLRGQIVDFDASRAQISFVFALATAAGALFGPLLGYLLDRYPVRRVMMAGAAWMGIGFIVSSQASSLVQFGVLTALFVGMGTGSIGTTASSKLMVDWFDRRRGFALAVANTGSPLAGIVMAPLALFMLETIGWRQSYWVFGGVLLMLVWPLVALFVRQPASRGGEAHSSAQFASQPLSQTAVYLGFARSPQFWTAVAVFGLMYALFSGLNLHLFLHFTDRGISAWQAASIISVEGAFNLISKPVTGWLIDRFGARRTAVGMLGGCLLALLGLLFAHSYSSALPVGAMLGFSLGSLVPTQAALLSRMFGPEQFARAYGSVRLAIFPLSVGAPLLIGYVYDMRGSYTAAFAIFACLIALALAATPILKREPASLSGSLRGTRV